MSLRTSIADLFRRIGAGMRPAPAAGAAVPGSITGDAPRPAAPTYSQFEACVAEVLRHEGGFVDNKADPGGATNHGISLRYARSQGAMFDLDRDGDVDRDDILLVNPAFAAQVYRDWFWADVRGDQLPPGVNLAVFDFAVNSGPMRAIRALQAAIGVETDGYIGPKTLAAVQGAPPVATVTTICDARLAWLRTLPTWPTFGKGWARRVFEVRDKALSLAVEGRR